MTDLRLAATQALEKIGKAHEKVSALCSGDERWTMSVPVRQDYDHDVVISDALRASEAVIHAALIADEAQHHVPAPPEMQAAVTAALAQPKCNKHPDAPHGFDRNGSHNADRYVCECEGWQPDVPEVLFDGYRVLKALTSEAATRTTHVNVSDVLDAVVALMREGTATPKSEPVVAEGYVLVPVDALHRWQAAFAEELGAWDINPPLHHVLTSHDEIASMLAAAPKGGTAPDGLPLVVSGAIFDFAGYLTTRPEAIEVGATANAAPIADLVKEWAKLRGLSLDEPAVLSWQEWLPKAPKGGA